MGAINVMNVSQIIERFIEISVKNDVQGFLKCSQLYPSCVDGVGVWGRWHRTPLMVAASCGSLEVVQKILTWPQVQVNRQCGRERVTALHCAASSGSPNAAAVLRLLLDAGADPSIPDAAGIRPREAIVMSSLQVPSMMHFLRNILLPRGETIPRTNDFLLETFKVYECGLSQSHQHNHQSCAYYHLGTGDRRRNPRRYSYSRERCPDFNRFGTCPRMDLCWMAHGYFERKLHPDVYKTALCRDGADCADKASCWYAHSLVERRNKPPSPLPLVSQGSYPYSYVQQKRILNEMQSSKS